VSPVTAAALVIWLNRLGSCPLQITGHPRSRFFTRAEGYRGRRIKSNFGEEKGLHGQSRCAAYSAGSFRLVPSFTSLPRPGFSFQRRFSFSSAKRMAGNRLLSSNSADRRACTDTAAVPATWLGRLGPCLLQDTGVPRSGFSFKRRFTISCENVWR
jgi:hypothetical protein